MTLAALFAPERARIVRAPLDRDQALSQLAELLSAGAALAAPEILRGLEAREDVRSTGFGDGVAIPHASFAEVDTPQAALLLVQDGVDFDALDGEPVRVFFGLIGPRNHGEGLRILARLARLMRSRRVRESLLEAVSAEEACATLLREEQEP